MNVSEQSGDSCYVAENMLTTDEAREKLLSAAVPVQKTEMVHISDAATRVLTSSVISPINVPGHANSAMDGYAVRVEEMAKVPVTKTVSQRIPAGFSPEPLKKNTVARIFTGAPVPTGADAVVMQEHTQVLDNGDVIFKHAVNLLQNIRPEGNDVKAGSEVMTAGTYLQAAHIGTLASLGIEQVNVVARLKVSIFSTGDELVEPGQPLAAAQIYNSNRYTLISLLKQNGCEVIDLGKIEDTLISTREALRKAAEISDLIITTGGVSVGEEDHVKNAVEAEGELSMWRIRMKPGKPVAFGRVANTDFIGLPGNPVSAFVTYLLFALPFIRKRQGRQADFFPQATLACLGDDWTRNRNRREFLRVSLQSRDAQLPLAKSFTRQGSDVMSGLINSDGLLEIPENRTFERGAIMRYWSFKELLA